MTDGSVDAGVVSRASSMQARALCVGERIDLRSLETGRRLAVAPLVLPAGARGCAVLFRFGAIVLFDVAALEEASFLDDLKRFVHQPFAEPQSEDLVLRVAGDATEGVDNGIVTLRAFGVERLQLVAAVLAKSVVLAHYEAGIAADFDRIEPLAASLRHHGRAGAAGRDLLRHLGANLLVQQKMVGRAEVGEKPDILWDHPELERLYVRLEDEYEIRERHLAMERKLALVAQSAQTLLDLLQHTRSLRVEWYIVLLIVVEILLTLYTLFVRS